MTTLAMGLLLPKLHLKLPANMLFQFDVGC